MGLPYCVFPIINMIPNKTDGELKKNNNIKNLRIKKCKGGGII